jgi:hypothetical protein
MGPRIVGLVTVCLIIFVFTGGIAQSRKDAKKYGIRSATVTRVTYSGSKESGSQTEKIEKFDKEGRVTDETDFDERGSFRKRTTWKYNKDGEVTEEVEWNAHGAVLKKTAVTFDENNRKVSEVVTDGTGKILAWTKSGYDSMGEKIFELELDEHGKTLKKSLYTYNKDGLKKERKTFNGQEELLYVKKYQYSGTGGSD